MKKIVRFLATLSLVSTLPLTSVSCSKQIHDEKIDLKDVFVQTDLGTITQSDGAKIPTAINILKQIKIINPKVNQEYINFKSLGEYSATIIGDDIHYKGQIDVTYQVDSAMDINSVIKNTNLGSIKTDGLKSLTGKMIISALKQANDNPEINWGIILIPDESITETGAKLESADSSIYKGEADVTYTIDSSVKLDTVIKKTELGPISTHGTTKPTSEQIFHKLKHLNTDEDINWTLINLDSDAIGLNSATIRSEDTSIYRGTVTVTYTLDLGTLLKELSLGVIVTRDSVTPNASQIIDAAKKVNDDKDINWDAIKVVNNSINETAARLESANIAIYAGEVEVKYTVSDIIDIKNVIKVSDLETIHINGEGKKPTASQIIDAAKKVNNDKDINWDAIKVVNNSITETGAKLESANADIYSGTIDVTYKIYYIPKLDSIIKQKNLNNIHFTTLEETIKLILKTVKLLNTDKDINWDVLELDDKTFDINSINLISTDLNIYTGTVTLYYDNDLVSN